MRIGDKENFLSIECVSRDDIRFLCFEAGAYHGEQNFTARVQTLGSWSPKAFAEFEDFKTADFEMRLVAGGWLRLERDHRGWIVLRYRLTSSRAPEGTAMEGEVWIEGERAGTFCRELQALFEAAS